MIVAAISGLSREALQSPRGTDDAAVQRLQKDVGILALRGSARLLSWTPRAIRIQAC
jgi:hypothetical protein